MMPVAVANTAQVISAATAIEAGTRLAATWMEKNRRSMMFARSMT